MRQSYGPRKIFLPTFSISRFSQIWPYLGQNPMPTTRKQNPPSTHKFRWPKFWARIIITLSIFSFRAWFSAQIVEKSLLYNPRWKSGSKRKYWQSYDNSRPLNLPSKLLCWRRVLLASGWCSGPRRRPGRQAHGSTDLAPQHHVFYP
jgi:hypothetical protein